MRYLMKRVRRLVVVIFAVTLFTFLLVNVLPGDVAYDIAGQDASEEEVQAIRADLGLDRPVMVRYVEWLGDFVQGDWGRSFRTDEPVVEAILSRFPVSLELMLVAQVFALILAVPFGIIAAYRAGRTADRAIATAGFMSLSIPSFMAAILLILVVSLNLGWLPTSEYEPLSAGLWANLRAFILPALAIAMAEWVILMRVLRADMIGVLQQDYISLARAKGLPESIVIIKHAARNGMIPILTLLASLLPALIGGSVVIEVVFGIPGMGSYLFESINVRDYNAVMSVLLISSALTLIGMLLSDLSYALVDPRISFE